MNLKRHLNVCWKCKRKREKKIPTRKNEKICVWFLLKSHNEYELWIAWLLSMRLVSLYRTNIADGSIASGIYTYVHRHFIFWRWPYIIHYSLLLNVLLFPPKKKQCVYTRFRACSMFNCFSQIFWLFALFAFFRSQILSYTRTQQQR